MHPLSVYKYVLYVCIYNIHFYTLLYTNTKTRPDQTRPDSRYRQVEQAETYIRTTESTELEPSSVQLGLVPIAI